MKTGLMLCGSEKSGMRPFLFLCLLISTDAVTLSGSSEYAVPGVEFRMICNTPEEAYQVQLYRRTNTTPVGNIQVGGGQCYNIIGSPVVCTTGVCSCTTTSDNYGTEFQWVIQPQTGDHGSVWYCSRTNPSLPEDDRIAESDDYTLKVADGPGTVTLTPPDTTYTRTEGDMLSDITCTADCRPGCTFVWTKPDNTNFTASPVLSLGQLNRSEHGTYRCTARNVVAELSTSTTVNVLYGPGTPTLSPQDTTYTRTEGDTLPDITCTADCRPGCTFVWTKPDNTNFTASPVLSLGQLNRSEHGTYRCTAKNVLGELSTSTTVNILYGPATVNLDPSTVSYTITEGRTLTTIRCSSDCNPACTYRWTKDGQSYTTGSDLRLTNIGRSQAGVYRCTASNSYRNQTSSDISVIVNYGPGDSVSFQPRQDGFDKIENQTVPDIICSADCIPACSFVWSKSGITYPNPLSVTTANRGNAGTYTCTASNSVSQTTKTWNLIVRFPPRILSLGYTQGNADVTENGSKSLLCSVESYPPSIISWYYQNGTNTLLTNTDVLESTYTLTLAGCLDTGMYTCSARNSISNIEATKDIRINVLCKPRQDHRVEQKYSFGLATLETLTIRANFLSNPQPSFNWTFQSSSGTPVTLLANGLDNFGIQNIFEMNELSAVSVGTRSSIKETWFGLYHVTATNSQGSGTLSFTAVAKGKPDCPKDGTARCPNHDSAVLSWRSAFNGGSNQTFAVGIKTHQADNFIIDKSLDYLYDPGPSQFINVTVSSLTPGTQHFFMVYAVNEFGNSSFEEEINCTTKGEPSSDSSSLGPVIGGVCGALAAIIVVIVVIIIIKTNRRKTGKKRKDGHTEMITQKNGSEEDGSSDGMKPNVLYESSDGLKPNVLYESSGPQPGSSSEYAIVQKTSKAKSVSPNSLYAEVDKPKKEKANVTDLYAEVVKPKTKDGKAGKQKVEKTKKKDKEKKRPNVGKVETANDAYEKVDAVVGAEDGVYANCKDNPKTVSDEGPANRKNQDGLIYLDIKFQEEQQSGRSYVIHGIENRTDYADIDFKNHVDGSSQKKEDVQGTKDNKNN